MECLYENGLKDAIVKKQELPWLMNFFEEHKKEICTEGCKSLISYEKEERFYMIAMNGDDEEKMSFLIKNDSSDFLHHYSTENEPEFISKAFDEALEQFLDYAEELRDEGQ